MSITYKDMISVVSQGLQSCLEPQLDEPRVLRHNFSPPHSNFSRPCPVPQKPNLSPRHKLEEKFHNGENNKTFKNDCNDPNYKNGHLGGFNILQCLTNTSQNCNEVVYVHPLDKRSASSLSSKSLEMCTESLGSESGSETSESSDDFSSHAWEKEKIQPLTCRVFTKKMDRSHSFPPPLTSITDSEGVQVRPHRENGRLIIKATPVSSCITYLQAERGDGRLRLSLLKECSVDCQKEEDDDEEEVTEAEAEEECCTDGSEDMEENRGTVGCEIGIGELPRPTRCKEGGHGNKGMPGWGLFRVAIS
ncbi:hypothetical protein RJ640_019770 [Escallonia rubra]|uniref:FAF domain-containing protein n=1 Tax=Escallonia rubra TaxID=112253 RepID=A0AA88QWG5_9ASTE|nr:hypothetical protein RJ640_019770 [Escallonia rubra]